MELTDYPEPLSCPLTLFTVTYPVALCCIVLCAVGDLGFAVIQDVPDDRDADHLLSTAHGVLRLLKGHNPAGCKERWGWSGGLGLRSISTPSLPPTQPRLQRNEKEISSAVKGLK